MRLVEALAAIRSSRFDLPLTYDAGTLELDVGDVVRIPLHNREVLAFVVSPVREESQPHRALKTISARLDVPRAFDDVGLHLAHFIAAHYLCTLGEALSAVVLSGSVPRAIERLARAPSAPGPGRLPSIPPRLIALMWEELEDGCTLDRLLRHPEARRIGDRAALLRHVSALVRAGYVRRERAIVDPRARDYRVRVLDLGEAAPKGQKAVALARFVAEQAGVPRADALLAGFSNAVIARAVRNGVVRERLTEAAAARGAAPFPSVPTATAEQAATLASLFAALDRGSFSETLLHGVTGSGKTYVYVEAIKRVVTLGGRAIVLVPEISLTPQTARRFEAAFSNRVAVIHSALSERERLDAWRACARGDVDVVVGARSAVFAPLSNVRLLVVDECHEPSYKQDAVPRYHAIAVARERMRREGGVLLLGSATPSVESFAAAQNGKIGLLRMTVRATSQPMPKVHVVDLSRAFSEGDREIFCPQLVQALAERLERGEKSVLFVNRRGSAGFLLCRACGFVPECPRCSVALSVHRAEGLLRCHYCDYQAPIPGQCRTCGQSAIREFGVGTEKVAHEVVRLFPHARLMRMDSDTTTRIGDHARILDAFEARGDVLVGTQMVAKGLDYPSVTLVGVVAADVGLHVADFRASERTYALIAQVCGRSGRARPGEAIVQTYAPSHPAIAFAAAHDYEGFAQLELQERAALGFPPARRLIYLGLIGRDRARVTQAAARYAELLALPDVEVLGPAPYPIARVNDEWRYRIALKTPRPAALRSAIRARVLPRANADRGVRVAINVDP